jgi:arylsulfatase A-like enzyme
MTCPNIVIYVAHDLGRFIGPYGVDTVQTPNLDRLAAEGIVFENHFATAPQCSPSRAGIFSGRHPHSNGCMELAGGWAGWSLREDEQHLAGLLGEQGYESALIGIAHEARGEYLEQCGFDDISRHWQHNAAEVGDHLSEWLQERERPEAPFFAEIGTMECHHPFLFHDIEPDDSLGVTVPEPLEAGPGTREFFADLQGCAQRWDRGLGELLSVLEERGLADNTIVIATTDHGVPAPRAKCTLYDPGLGTLLLMRCPEKLEAGTRHDCMLSNIDLVPTLLEAVGAEIPARVQGRSFWPLLQGQEYEEREEIYAEKTYHTQYDPMRCIRTDRYKYIRNFEGVTHEHCCRDCQDREIYTENLHLRSVERQDLGLVDELYDLHADPLEMNNLADESEYQDVLAELKGRLLRWMEKTNDPLLDGPVAAPFFYQSLEDFKKAGRRK